MINDKRSDGAKALPDLLLYPNLVVYCFPRLRRGKQYEKKPFCIISNTLQNWEFVIYCMLFELPAQTGTSILSLPPIYILRGSGMRILPSSLRLFSRNAISILGGATTVLLSV